MAAKDLTGRPIVITGASSGIGRATAFACAQAGMPVTLAARRADRLEAVREQIETLGGRAIAVAADVQHKEDCERLKAEAEAAFGTVYSVFANAGYGFQGAIDATPESELRRIFEVNFWGSLNTILPFVDGMKSAGAGHLLMCSSCLSKLALPYYGAYSATKAAQDHFGRSMRLELRGTGVHVSTVHPVGTRTEFFDVADEQSAGGATLVKNTPDRFMQPPEKVADAIVACLRRPRGEVWTSFGTRLQMALATLLPGTADRALAGIIAKRQQSASS
ncbi:MAG: SDR family NAD(P)-dependent oxidoreductase [Planctomycetota bacterium]